jgi:hypothetical protein
MQEHEEVTAMDQVERMLQRPKLYNNIDGVGELGMGFMLLCFALLQWISNLSPAGSVWHRYGSFVWFMVMFAVIHYGSKAIKKHITYPRTGFVEYRRQKTSWWLAFTLGGVTAVAIWGLALVVRSHSELSRSHWGITTPAALVGLVFVVFYAYWIARPVRWKWAVAAALAICSVVIAMLPAGVVAAVAGSTSAVATLDERSSGALILTITIYGAIFLISGGISFVLYLRHTQPAVETAE